MTFQRTTAINKLLKLKKKKRVVPGGTSAGKTYGITPIAINKCIKTPGHEFSIVSESMPHLRKGVMKDFLKIMKETNRFQPDRWSKTLSTYTFGNGSYIEFFSADNEGKVRGPRRNELYINECNRLKFETYHQLAIRTSGPVWLDFNPSNKFWVHEELPEDENTEWLTLTYKDNEALPPEIVEEIESAREKAKTSKYWENWWNVYGLGKLGMLEGVVFDSYEIIDMIPSEAELKGVGIDFGYTNDPTAIVEIWEWNGMKILNEVLYQRKMQNRDIADFLSKQGYSQYLTMVADSAEPKSIDDINSYGWSLVGAQKGADSIVYGVNLMQEEPFYITKDSTNLIKEYREYCYDQDRDGNTLNHKFVGRNDHGIDAARYLYSKLYGKGPEDEGQVIYW